MKKLDLRTDMQLGVPLEPFDPKMVSEVSNEGLKNKWLDFQVVRKQGNSLTLTIPYTFAKAMELRAGNSVFVFLDLDTCHFRVGKVEAADRPKEGKSEDDISFPKVAFAMNLLKTFPLLALHDIPQDRKQSQEDIFNKIHQLERIMAEAQNEFLRLLDKQEDILSSDITELRNQIEELKSQKKNEPVVSEATGKAPDRSKQGGKDNEAVKE